MLSYIRRHATALLMLGAVGIAAPAASAHAKQGQSLYAVLISALNNVPNEVDELNAISKLDARDVKIIDLSKLLDDNNRSAYQRARSRGQAHFSILRTAVNGHATLRASLAEQNVSANRVVALTVSETGAVMLFVEPAG